MRTKQEIEKEVVDYFRKFKEHSLIDYAKECALENFYTSSIIKFPYTFDNFDTCDFTANNIVDIAVFDIKKMKFTEIHYPWRTSEKELVYNVINLEEYEKDND